MRISFVIAITALIFITACNGQVNTSTQQSEDLQMSHYELTPETAHPKARKLLTEDFYWSPVEETGPFGSDDGSDAFYGFREWRMSNKKVSPVKYIEELLINWNYPKFNLNELDSSKIRDYISAKTQAGSPDLSDQMPAMMEHFKQMAKEAGQEFDENQFKEIMAAASGSMGGTYLLGIDNAIIAVGFGQFVLEGKIDEDIKVLAQTAIKRELLPVLIDRWDGAYKKTRKEQLNSMLGVIDKMNE
jgi:uncharacterized protein YfeS